MALTEEEKSKRAEAVAREYEGIVPYFEAFYIEAIIYAAGQAADAFRRFDDSVANNGERAGIVAAVHEALTHTAALSRFFWPSRKTDVTKARAQKLRKAFQIEDNSALQERELRNALEHFDERLDDFLLEDHAGYFFPGPMVDDADLSEEAVGHIFRLVDPKTLTFVLLGNQHNFGELRAVTEDILGKARTMLEGDGRLSAHEIYNADL